MKVKKECKNHKRFPKEKDLQIQLPGCSVAFFNLSVFITKARCARYWYLDEEKMNVGFSRNETHKSR